MKPNSVRWRADTVYVKNGKWLDAQVYVWGEYSFCAQYTGFDKKKEK